MFHYKNFIFLAAISCFATACIPVAIVGAGAAAGTSLARDSRSLQTISDDTNIQFQLNQAIETNKALTDQASISTLTFNRVVLLVGQVPSEALRVKAEHLAQQIPKVRRVYNQIQVAPDIGAIQAADDATISANIKARMMVTSNLNSDNFKYLVDNKVVYLMGLASREQTNIVVDVIRNSSGVKKVVTLVEIDNTYGDAPSASTTTSGAPANTQNNPPPATDTSSPAPVTSNNTTNATTRSTSTPTTTPTTSSSDGDLNFKPVKEG
jgi:osmotically-inducible protein OsmY